uniref:Nucleic acid-binding protein, contains PIN domain n=1 Tax=Candidatus Kentrum sp. MB TaxID=2138164 RepID=A0A451BB39_9GAMM|nr:MAG: hypothetical protein BECKMB1821G_GA0114241_10266 [Candidatus Kentron sp. MB]VFK31028.1 MAG: hypothetical protein BECKMB1821I_GA0114274_10207 [Candidatus Kentron sp. MB]VFK75489.1 MAG: hypothetical protein BECKMB1821H_GA0114242_10246 [Candidatus Kentron sp. MB]
MKEIIADSGPLIIFARSNLLEVLQQIVESVLIPTTVFEECVRESNKPGAKTIHAAKSNCLLHVVPDASGDALQSDFLDRGEIAVLQLALERALPVLMDERQGRKEARRLGIPVIGSAGILLKAKSFSLIGKVKPILDQWKDFGYYYAPELIHGILEKAGE